MKTSNKGITLLEMVVAVLVFSMTILFVYRLFIMNYQFYLHSKQKTLVSNLAQLKMEEVRKRVLAGDFSVTTGNFSGGYGTYQYDVEYKNYDPGSFLFDNGQLVRVRVVASGPYTGAILSPAGKRVVLVTLIAKRNTSFSTAINPVIPPTPPAPPTPFPLPP